MYLLQRRRNPWFTGIPMVFMLGSTLFAMARNLMDFLAQEAVPWPLVLVGGALLVLGAWLVIEALLAILRARREPPRESLLVLEDESAA